MEEKKNRPAFRGRDAAMLGGIAGGIHGTFAPFKDIDYTNEIISSQIYQNPQVPSELEAPAIMTAGASAALTQATLGALGAAAAYQLLKAAGKGAIKGGKAIKKAIDKSKEKSSGN